MPAPEGFSPADMGSMARRRAGPADAVYGTGAPTKADNARAKRGAAARDKARADAYAAGQRGDPVAAFDGDPELTALHGQGKAAGPAGRAAGSAASSKRPTWGGAAKAPWRAGATVDRSGVGRAVGSDDLAGLFVGLLGYVVVVNYLRGGLPAVRGWFAAKFLNRPYTGNLTPLAGSTPATGPLLNPNDTARRPVTGPGPAVPS